MTEKTRLIMTRDTALPLGCPPFATTIMRNLQPADAAMLGDLLYDSYKGTVDDSGETREESHEESHATLHGRYGAIIWKASYVVQRRDRLICATIVSDYEKLRPLLSFAVTLPEHQGKGLATRLISASLKSLKELGIPQLHLVVTESNHNAARLYRKLGFIQTGIGSGDC